LTRCKLCVHRGLACTPKVSAREFRHQQGLLRRISEPAFLSGTAVAIPRQPAGPATDTQLPQFEITHLRTFHARKSLFTFVRLQEFRTDGRHFQGVVVRRFGPWLTSKVVRYGMILCMLGRVGDTREEQLVYVNRFFKAMSDVLERRDHAEVLYGCYLICHYSIRSGASLHEVLSHASAFRLSALCFQDSFNLSTEESLLLWCMWEKSLWNAARKFLFHSSDQSLESLETFSDLATPFMAPDPNWPVWMQDSYADVDLKLQFIQFMIKLGRNATAECMQVKASISRRFKREWKRIKSVEGQLVSTIDTLILRKLSNSLWSNLIKLLDQRLFDALSLSESTIGTIRSSLSVVAHSSPYQKYPRLENQRLERFFDSVVYALVLIGLLLSEWQGNVLLNNAADFALVGSLLDTARSYLHVITLHLENPAIMTMFDEASLDCLLQHGMHSKQVSALSEWTRICG